LDLFCGGGEIWKNMYVGLPYVGVDSKIQNDERETISCDNRRLLRHVAFNVRDYNVFDLDAYGMPWEQWWLVVHRLGKLKPQERIVVFLTDGGLGGKTRMCRKLPNGVCDVLGIDSDTIIDDAFSNYANVISALMKKTASLLNSKLVWSLYTKKRAGLMVHYFGVCLEGE